MSLDRVLNVKVLMDNSGLSRGMKGAGDETEKTSKRLLGLGKAAAFTAGGAGVAALVVGLKSSVNAAKESQKAQARLEESLKSANVSYAKHGAAIDSAIQKTSRLAALDDEDLSDSFAKLVGTTKDVTKATEGMNLAADIARARNVSLETATKAVEKAYLGSDAALKKFGVSVPTVTSHLEAAKAKVEALKAAHDGKLSPALAYSAEQMLKQAKAADKSATSHNALEAANKRFAGSAEAYGKTAAGAQEKLNIALENVQETIGSKVLPILTFLLTKLVEVVDWATVNWPRFSQAFTDAYNRFAPIISRMREILDGYVQYLRGMVNIVIGIFTGDWQRAWDGMKTAVVGALNAAKAVISLQMDVWKAILSKLGEVAVDAFGKAIDGLKGLALAALVAAKNLLLNSPEILTRALVSVASNAVSGFATVIGFVVDKVTGALGRVPGAITGAIAGAAAAASSYGASIARAIVSGLGDIGRAIGDRITRAVNYAIGRVNAAINKINKALEFTTPSLSIPFVGDVGGVTVNPPDIPSISYMAKGGVVTGPTLAMIGEGRYDEAVVPLDRYGGGLGLGGPLTVVVPVMLDGREIARAARTYGQKEASSLVASSVTGEGAYGLA